MRENGHVSLNHYSEVSESVSVYRPSIVLEPLQAPGEWTGGGERGGKKGEGRAGREARPGMAFRRFAKPF